MVWTASKHAEKISRQDMRDVVAQKKAACCSLPQRDDDDDDVLR